MDAVTPELIRDDESARKSGRKSARNARIEVLVRADRRRSWTTEQKQEIVAESLGSGLTSADVARKHGISTGQLTPGGGKWLAGKALSRPTLGRASRLWS